MPGSFLASVVDGATAGRPVVTGLAVEAATVAVVAAGTSVVAGAVVAAVASVVVPSVVVAADTADVVVEVELAVTISLDGAAAGDGFGEHAAVTTTAIARTSDRASTKRTYAAAP
jgi:hypothetical protein